MPGITRHDPHELNSGFETFKQGFLEAGLASIPEQLQDRITRLEYDSYKDFIMARVSSDSRYWAPEIRVQRVHQILIPYIFGFIHELQEAMALELERLVNDPARPDWTDDKAQDFARNKAGKLLLALLGDFKSELASTVTQTDVDNRASEHLAC